MDSAAGSAYSEQGHTEAPAEAPVHTEAEEEDNIEEAELYSIPIERHTHRHW
jgi:hypothetical protein